jgi:hypothetical protein
MEKEARRQGDTKMAQFYRAKDAVTGKFDHKELAHYMVTNMDLANGLKTVMTKLDENNDDNDAYVEGINLLNLLEKAMSDKSLPTE